MLKQLLYTHIFIFIIQLSSIDKININNKNLILYKLNFICI